MTLRTARPLDATERHFAVALAFFAVVAVPGLSLGLVRSGATLPGPCRYGGLADAHATVAVFGAVLTTVVGALYRLGTAFTGTDLDRPDRALRRVETVAYPVGAVALAAGRLVGNAAVARVGAVLVAGGLLAVGVVLARRLHASAVERTPMHSRYAVVAGATVTWAVLALRTWLGDPLSARFGGPAARPLLFVGVVGFVVLGTLYHVVPFLVWMDRYGDRLGRERVPAVEDLYDDRVAAADFWLVGVGLAGLVADGAVGVGPWGRRLARAGVLAGACLVAANLALVVHRHGRCPARRLPGPLGDDGESPPEAD